MTFKSLGLSDSLLHAINKKGHTEPSPIQQKAIPHILERKDVLASAQTGTGKTAGFVLPVLQVLAESKQPRRRPVRALVLTPTRELAAQVYENVVEYSEFLPINSTVIFGGVNQNPQVRELRNGVDFLVATPGRLLDLHGQGKLFLNQVEVLILDEADRMLDMGFLRDIKKILPLLPPRRQNLLFSATFSKEIKLLAGTFMFDPVMVEATPENTTVEKIVQKAYFVDKTNKTPLVIKLIKEGNWQQILVFMRTKHSANRLSKRLDKSGITAAAIHGDKSQGARTKALANFKKGEIRVLVATDIAARGLDIPLLPHVINYDLPHVSEDYVHRIGRTGRAGASGEAISLVAADERDLLRGIERLIQEKLPTDIVEGFEPTDVPEPAKESPKRGQPNRNKQRKRQGGESKPQQRGQGNQSTGAPKKKRNPFGGGNSSQSGDGGGKRKFRPKRR